MMKYPCSVSPLYQDTSRLFGNEIHLKNTRLQNPLPSTRVSPKAHPHCGLQKERRGSGEYRLVSTKNGKSRRITAAALVMDLLKRQRERQAKWKRSSGEAWEESGLVFTNEVGHHLSTQTVYLHFKGLVKEAGYPDRRFHDLRHSYAVACLQNGNDIKTLQENLGHHTAAFTLDVYGHVTAQMKRASADRIEAFIQSVSSG